MKNIGIFTHDLYPFKPWGQGRYVYDLAKRLRKSFQGNVFVFSPSENINDDQHIGVFYGSHNTFGKNVTFSIKLGFAIEKIIKKHNLSLLHFQGGPGGLFIFKKPSVPLIYTVHHTYYQQSRYISAQTWKKVLYLWEKISYRKSNFLICDSPSTQRIVLRYYQGCKFLCETIPIGVDKDRFFPLSVEKIPNSLFFLGRLEKRKGIDFLIKAIPLVKDRIQDIQLFIGGNGVLKSCLTEFINENNLQQNVHFLGTIEDVCLNTWYNKVEAVVVPSIFEGFGLTAVESMASGTPVIATKVDAVKDVITDGLNGILVRYSDVEGLSEKIISLLGNRLEKRRLSANGIKYVKKNNNWSEISRKIMTIYDRYSNK